MSFSQESSKVPTSIGDIVIVLHDLSQEETDQRAQFRINILDQNGELLDTKRGDLQPHLTGTQITQILTFLTDIRTQAENEILPP